MGIAQAGIAFRSSDSVSDLAGWMSGVFDEPATEIPLPVSARFDIRNHSDVMVQAFGEVCFISNDDLAWPLIRNDGANAGRLHAALGAPDMLLAVFSAFMLATLPISNTIVRTQEIEADRFGLNLAREPHGEAEVDLKLTEYRKPDPGPIEEFLFFDHPGTRHRIHDAMQWREAMGTP